MDQNKKNNQKPGRPGGGKGGGWQGLIQVICWAGVLAILLSYANNYMRSAGTQSSSCRGAIQHVHNHGGERRCLPRGF